MTDEKNNIPVDNSDESNAGVTPETPETPESTTPESTPPTASANPPASSTPPPADEDMGDRLERLGGEPAPVITPEEFARLQKAGQVHIDSRGRVRTARRSEAEAGVSLRKRRAWYVKK
ncbi:MAG: hypothetical protein CL607_20890 [Anaerolineaceae bacterium]|nr:hypothetical protein [Anaerolineaceae bacterium]